MDTTGNEVQDTLSLIESAGLPYPSGPLLESFVTEALNPVVAARFAKPRLLLGEGSLLASDWSYIVQSITQNGSTPPKPDSAALEEITKRDGHKCCVTGKPGTRRDPLIVTPILPVPSGWITHRPGINDMLGAFFGPPYRDWWLSYVRNPEFVPPHSNHWLVRKSAAMALARGSVKLDRCQPSMVEYKIEFVGIIPGEPIEVDGLYPLLGDHSRQNIQKVDPRFIGSHARLCKAIQFLDIAKTMSANKPQHPPPNSYRARATRHMTTAPRIPFAALSGLFSRALLLVWRAIPAGARFATYGLLHKFGKLLYGEDHPYVQKLPFGLYLKYHEESAVARNEFNALRVVCRHTSVPTPSALDVALGPTDSFSSPVYLLTTKIRGLPLTRCFYVLSDQDFERIATQLKDYIAQLRDIPSSFPPDKTICNTLGEACRDTRICGERPVGPFPDEAAFSQVVRFSDDPARRGHKTVFTHADLNPRNILVDRITRPDGTTGWEVSGIVDWESAGHYPEYWEYTKAMFEGFRWPKRYNDVIHGVFKEFGDYSQELDVERRSWESGDAV